LTLERFIAGVSRREVTFGPRLAVAAKEGLDLFWTPSAAGMGRGFIGSSCTL